MPHHDPDTARTLLALLLYASWTLLLLAAIAVVRWRVGRSGRIRINQFRTTGEDVSPFSGRLCRAHANCVENLGVFGAITGVALLSGQAAVTGPLALWCVAARLGQSAAHLYSTRARWVLVRFAFMVVQIGLLASWLLRLLPGLL